MEKITIHTENIQLDQLLKWAGIVESGGQVKLMLEDEIIKVNGNIETARRRRKPQDLYFRATRCSFQSFFPGNQMSFPATIRHLFPEAFRCVSALRRSSPTAYKKYPQARCRIWPYIRGNS